MALTAGLAVLGMTPLRSDSCQTCSKFSPPIFFRQNSLTIHGTTGVPTPIGFDKNFVCTAQIGGDVRASGNEAPLGIGDFSICTNPITVGHDLGVSSNTAQVLVSNNTIRHDLACYDNRPPATGVPGSNQVGHEKLGECSGL